MNREKLREFVVEAHRNGYASTEPEETDSGEKVIRFEKDDWRYIDRYRGSRDFIGYETVFHKDKPVWGMNYYGYIVEGDEDRIYRFLRKALKQVSEEHPFRAPEFQEGKLKYVRESEGGIERFSGSEKVLKEGKTVYRGFFRCGLIS